VSVAEQHTTLQKIRLQPVQKIRLLPVQAIIPGAAGCVMLGASVLPWLNDPLQGFYSAWKLPIEIGWQFHTSILSYGLLCLCCALLNFFSAYAHFVQRKQSKKDRYFAPGYVSLGIFSMVPFFLFLLQYLCADVQRIDVLAQHITQALLIDQHFGYNVSGQLISLSPFKFSSATFSDRFVLLVDQVGLGAFVPLVNGYLLIHYRRFQQTSGLPIVRKYSKRIRLVFLPLGLVLLVAGLGRSPAAMMCEYAAKSSLATGDSVTALEWLQAALFLNPALDRVSYFHIDRGEAYYTLHPDIQSDDSRIYLSSVYREAGDYLDSEQELIVLWRTHPTTPWVVAEASVTFELLAEFQQQQSGSPLQRAENDVASMTWLQLLSKVDPTNVYAQYVRGRLQYYLHSYTTCMSQMNKVIQLSSNADIQSSAYTYMGLSREGQRDVVNARKLFFKALDLDPNYYNNTAREELSGLH
jgi:tetratricopeptide (TPR) repeat protein